MRKGKQVPHVEVKGTTTAGEQIVLTANEVGHARNPKHNRVLVATVMLIFRLACNSERPSPDMLRGAAMAYRRYGIDFRGGVPVKRSFAR
jgi:hypothetical protein